jgi:hypothetical protein
MDAPHKQSGDIDNPDNFENHKKASNDIASKKLLEVYNDEQMQKIYENYFQYLKENESKFDPNKLKEYYPSMF